MRTKGPNVVVLFGARERGGSGGGIAITQARVTRIPSLTPRLLKTMERLLALRPTSSNPDDFIATPAVRNLFDEAMEELAGIIATHGAVILYRHPGTGVVLLWLDSNGKLHVGGYPRPEPDPLPIAPLLAAAELHDLAGKIGNLQVTRRIEAEIQPLLEMQAAELMTKAGAAPQTVPV